MGPCAISFGIGVLRGLLSSCLLSGVFPLFLREYVCDVAHLHNCCQWNDLMRHFELCCRLWFVGQGFVVCRCFIGVSSWCWAIWSRWAVGGLLYFVVFSYITIFQSVGSVSHEEQRVADAMCLGMDRGILLVSGACVGCRDATVS